MSTQLLLVPRLRMSGSVHSPIRLYAVHRGIFTCFIINKTLITNLLPLDITSSVSLVQCIQMSKVHGQCFVF